MRLGTPLVDLFFFRLVCMFIGCFGYSVASVVFFAARQAATRTSNHSKTLVFVGRKPSVPFRPTCEETDCESKRVATVEVKSREKTSSKGTETNKTNVFF